MYALHYENLQLYLRLGIKLKKIYRILQFSQLQCQLQLQSLYVQLNPQNRIQIEKNEEKDGIASYKLIEQCRIRRSNGKLEKYNRCRSCN